MFSNMSYKILNNILQSNNKCINLNNYRVLYRYISGTGALAPETRVSTNPNVEYKRRENIQEELLSTALKSGRIPSETDWESLKNSVLSRGKSINEINFDSKALGLCIAYKNFDAGKSLLNFYQSKNGKFNIGALGKYMKLCHVCNEEKNFLDSADEEKILELYKQVKEQYPLLSAISAENIITAISLTSEWRSCLDLLNTIKLTQVPSIGSYSVTVKAAFANNENELGWKLINEMSNDCKYPHPSVYKTWLNKVSESQVDVIKNVKMLFKYFVEHDILPTKDVTDQIIETLKPFNYSGIYGDITGKGKCQSCKLELKKIVITDSDFGDLKSIFMSKVIVGKNVFTKTNPEELEKFKKFVSSGKYDLVIDGLNVAYSAGKQRPDVYGKLLANVVSHCRLKNNNILVLGRSHMNKWPQKYMDYIKSHATMFLTQDMSQDDPFLLYAAMSSGLGTNFLSRDYMRSHIYLLMDTKFKTLFRRWQQVHQYSLIYAENQGHVRIKDPFPYLCVVQESKKGWHIPYVDTYVPIQPMSFDPPKNWLCICKNKIN